MMKQTESVELFLRLCRPGGARKIGPIGVLFRKPNKEQTIGERTNDALRRFDESLHFLAGVLTVLPLLNVQTPILKSDSEKLFVDLQRMRRSIKPKRTTAFIRLLRKHEEKIDRLVSKIEKSGKNKQ